MNALHNFVLYKDIRINN